MKIFRNLIVRGLRTSLLVIAKNEVTIWNFAPTFFTADHVSLLLKTNFQTFAILSLHFEFMYSDSVDNCQSSEIRFKLLQLHLKIAKSRIGKTCGERRIHKLNCLFAEQWKNKQKEISWRKVIALLKCFVLNRLQNSLNSRYCSPYINAKFRRVDDELISKEVKQ